MLVSCSAGSLLEDRCKQEGSWFVFDLISPGLYILKRASTQNPDADRRLNSVLIYEGVNIQ